MGSGAVAIAEKWRARLRMRESKHMGERVSVSEERDGGG